MKSLINYIIGTAIALVVFTGCSDWLDVNPRSEIKESVLFASEDGYKKALTGAYILMAQTDLYGKNTSMYMPELFARNWTVPAISPTDAEINRINRVANFQYTHADVEPMINKTWLSYYKVIVQLNDILQHLEDNQQVRFAHKNDLLLKGEALGLRAFLHLDLLRFFGPVPAGSNPQEPAIPYVMEKTKNPASLVSIPYSEVIKNIEADLDAAEQILAEADPILRYNYDELNRPQVYIPEGLDDSWQWYRQERFNYYACLGTKARLYQWTGDKEKAAYYAKKVIDAQNSNNTPKFELTKESDYLNSWWVNLTMHKEQLFGINNPDLRSIVDPMFNRGTDIKFTQTVTNMNNCYENTISPSDIRYKPSNAATRYWEEKTYQSSRVNHFRKYTGNDQIAANNKVPLLRLAEMYLILVESLPLGEATTYFSAYRIARSMDISIEATSMADESTRKVRLEKEYRKEFFGEGQMFFFYKRLNYSAYTWPTNYALPVGVYVLPKPQSQLIFE